MIGDDWEILDHTRSADLSDVGAPDYLATTVVSAEGSEYLVLAERNSLGNPTVRFDADCSAVDHEQTGPLPLEYCRRLAINRRRQRTEGTDQ